MRLLRWSLYSICYDDKFLDTVDLTTGFAILVVVTFYQNIGQENCLCSFKRPMVTCVSTSEVF